MGGVALASALTPIGLWLGGLAGTSWIPLGLGLASSAGLAGLDPRRHRPFAIPVLVGLLAAVAVLLPTDPLAAGLPGVGFLVVALAFVSALRSVNGSALRGGPPV